MNSSSTRADTSKDGHVYYVFRSKLLPGIYKLGITGNLDRRWNEHGGPAKHELIHHAALGAGYAYRFEQKIKRQLRHLRITDGNELFALDGEHLNRLLGQIASEEQQAAVRKLQEDKRRIERDFADAQRQVAQGEKRLTELRNQQGLTQLQELTNSLALATDDLCKHLEAAGQQMGLPGSAAAAADRYRKILAYEQQATARLMAKPQEADEIRDRVFYLRDKTGGSFYSAPAVWASVLVKQEAPLLEQCSAICKHLDPLDEARNQLKEALQLAAQQPGKAAACASIEHRLAKQFTDTVGIVSGARDQVLPQSRIETFAAQAKKLHEELHFLLTHPDALTGRIESQALLIATINEVGASTLTKQEPVEEGQPGQVQEAMRNKRQAWDAALWGVLLLGLPLLLLHAASRIPPPPVPPEIHQSR